jgi:hypothetical protein
MKQTYAAPSVISNGLVVRETLSAPVNNPESISTQPLTAGRVGFYL